VLGRGIGLVFCGIVLAASGAAGVLKGPEQWRAATTPGGHVLGLVQLVYGVTGFVTLWGLLRPGRWMWPVFGAWAIAIIVSAALSTLMAAEPAARWLLTTSAVVVSTVFVGAVVGFARRALRDTHEEEGNAS
jgi:hypothetical protein